MLYVCWFCMHDESSGVCSGLTTTAGLFYRCLSCSFTILGSIRGICRIAVRHWRRDVICLAHHGRQSVCLCDRNPPAALLEYLCVSVNETQINKDKLQLLLWLSRASWLHTRGTSLQKQVYRGRTVLYIVPITRGFLLPSSWPLCLCVAPPHLLRVALRKATRDNSCALTSFSISLALKENMDTWMEVHSILYLEAFFHIFYWLYFAKPSQKIPSKWLENRTIAEITILIVIWIRCCKTNISPSPNFCFTSLL